MVRHWNIYFFSFFLKNCNAWNLLENSIYSILIILLLLLSVHFIFSIDLKSAFLKIDYLVKSDKNKSLIVWIITSPWAHCKRPSYYRTGPRSVSGPDGTPIIWNINCLIQNVCNFSNPCPFRSTFTVRCGFGSLI